MVIWITDKGARSDAVDHEARIFRQLCLEKADLPAWKFDL